MRQEFFFRFLSIWRRCMVVHSGTLSSRSPTGRILGVVSQCYCLSRHCYFRASQQCHICYLSAKHRRATWISFTHDLVCSLTEWLTLLGFNSEHY